MPGFNEVIQEVWNQPVNTQDAILRMHIKLIQTAKALKLWKRQNLGNIVLRLAIAKEVLLLLEVAQEQRTLTLEELEFRRYLKAKLVGLATIQRTRARQHLRLTWIRKGDTNYIYHHSPRVLESPQIINRKRKQYMNTSYSYWAKHRSDHLA